MRTPIYVLGLIAAGALVLAGCGDDDEDKGGGSKAQTLSVGIDAQNKLTGIKTVEGGVVQIDFKNGAKSPYDLQVVKVDGNQTVADVLKVTNSEEDGQPIPPWLHGVGGVGSTKPGATGSSTQVLGPGKYYAIASAETEGEGPKPATAPLQVSGGSDSGELPQTPATINATEYDFDAQGLKRGKNTVNFTNNGKELHHVVAAPMTPGKTLADVKKFIQTEKGQPPLQFEQAVSTVVLDGKTQQVTDLEFAKSGKYALLCFITDRKGGPPHVAKGMVAEADVQ